jgi:hypothetical protein
MNLNRSQISQIKASGSSIRCNLEFDSNVTDVSDVHAEKQTLYTTSTDAEISMAFTPLH